MDAQTLLVLTAVGTLATAIFTGYPIVQRMMDRPRPRWRFTRSELANRDFADTRACLFVTATNIGDGPAFNVLLSEWDTTCVGGMSGRRGSSSLGTGESVSIAVHMPIEPDWEADRYGNTLDMPARVEDIGDAGVMLTWNQPPHRWVKRRKRKRARRLEA